MGASPRAGAFSERTLHNLSAFAGTIDLINARYERIGERLSYPSLHALPARPDCVVVALPFDLVEQAVAECVEVGAGGVIVYASGYAETGVAERKEMQARLADLVSSSPTRLLGPNCYGYYNFLNGANVAFGRTVAARFDPLQRPNLGLVSQSGALGMALAQAMERGVAISHMLTAGNSADVGIADLVAYLSEDPNCDSIGCVFEGTETPRQILEAADIARGAGKPLVVYKAGRSNAGSAAALSHTGSVAGDYAIWKAACEARGAVMVDDFEAIVEVSLFLAKAGRPKARGAIAVVTSGGAGVIAADKGEAWRVPMPQPTGETLAILKENLPEFAACRNPCDVTAQVLNDDTPLRLSAGALLHDQQYGVAVVPHPFADAIGEQRVKMWKELGENHDKIICYVWCSEWLEGPGVRQIEASRNLALFRSMDRCFAAIAAWHRREEVSRGSDASDRIAVPSYARLEAERLLKVATTSALTERESKEILVTYGVPVVAERLTTRLEEAVEAAEQFGFPVVLKLESPDILHKTEYGAVRIGLNDTGTVSQAFWELDALASKIPNARRNGVLVQKMARRGLEIMVGGRVDPELGPVVVVSLGGTLVELFSDSVTRAAPLTHAQALKMLHDLRAAKALKGFRDLPAADTARLADVICRVGEFLLDHKDQVVEVDINPLICSGDELVAVDALVVRRYS